MGNWVRCALKVMAVTLTVSAGLALAGPNDQDQDGLISVTATIDNVECLRCFHWNGVGGAKRVADKLIATVSKPAEFAGKSVALYVWDEGAGISEPWEVHSEISFPTTPGMIARERLVFPRSQLEQH
jgi:hypothetical protein